MKTYHLEIKDEKTWHKFRQLCLEKHDTAAARLRRYIKKSVDDWEREKTKKTTIEERIKNATTGENRCSVCNALEGAVHSPICSVGYGVFRK